MGKIKPTKPPRRGKTNAERARKKPKINETAATADGTKPQNDPRTLSLAKPPRERNGRNKWARGDFDFRGPDWPGT